MAFDVKKIVRTCEACPSQWEGILSDGQSFYMRFRWGSFGFGVGKTLDEAIDNCVYTDKLGDRFDGFLTNGAMRQVAEPHGFNFTGAVWRDEA